MRRFKLEGLGPYARDIVAFAVLGVFIAVILAVSFMNGPVQHPSLSYGVTSSTTSTF